MAYSKAKFKSNSNKASPRFKPFLLGNRQTDAFLPRFCYRFHAETFVLALTVSWGYQAQYEYYTTPPS